MVSRHNRLLVTFHVLSDALLGVTAFIIAYELRFHSDFISSLIPITKGMPPLRQYINVLPFIAVLVPLGFQLQGLYRLRRGRSRVDDFFAVFVGSILAVVFGIVATIYVQIYFTSGEAKARGAFEVSQPVWAIFLVLNVMLTFAARELVREWLERRWRAGISLKRILIAGSGELGRLVADKIIEHRELGYQIIGFVDDKAPGDHLGYRGLPLLGTIEEAADIAARETIDHLYVALPPEQHVQMLQLIESTSRECVDVKVVPDLLQVIALRARLEDLDGLPVININDVPLQGFNAIVKRCIDIAISSAALLGLMIPFWIIAALVKLSSRGDIFYRQERMGLDGKPFMIYKFRSMYDGAEAATGPVFASERDPRRTPLGRLLRRSNVDELPQLWNVLRGDMSIVGPRPERPLFVAQFKDKIPQYMLRHKVKAGITGWAQVNGWRGNTSIEKRIEYDLYYIENWSVRLDLKIMWLTLLKGFFHKHAY
jgi:Undecaprenyl-phosphate glucose phosphotransferase